MLLVIPITVIAALLIVTLLQWRCVCVLTCSFPQDSGETIDPALRVVAYSMEEGNWDLVEWMINNHQSQELGPYFLPAIAQVHHVVTQGCMLIQVRTTAGVMTCISRPLMHFKAILLSSQGSSALPACRQRSTTST